MGQRPKCYIPGFKVICHMVLKQKILEGFFTIYGCGSHFGHVTQSLHKLSFPYPQRLHIKFGLGQAVLEKRFFENGREAMDGQTMTNRRMTELLVYSKLTSKPSAQVS